MVAEGALVEDPEGRVVLAAQVGGLADVSFGVAKSARFVWKKSLTLITKRLTRFDGSSQRGLR